jgi:hypothetical protein
MRRFLLALAALLPLLASDAFGRASNPPPPAAVQQFGSAPRGAADALGLQSQAPRRARLTAMPGSINLAYAHPATNTTYEIMLPLEAQAYAVRVGVAYPFGALPMIITSAAAYPSDSYSGYLQSGTVFALNTRTNTMPTANSVFQSCTIAASSTSMTCSNTGVLPSASTMYVVGPQLTLNTSASTPDVTGTIADGTHVTLSAVAQQSGTFTFQFFNLASECKIYWDNAGGDSDTINNTTTGARALTIPGNPANVANAILPYTVQWSDFVPCTTVPRADGGTLPLMTFYIALSGAGSYARNSASMATYDANIASGLGGRYIFESQSWQNNDFSDAPNTDGGQKGVDGFRPIVAVQYYTPSRGWQILMTGDSIAAAPPDDNFSNTVYRACKNLSTPQAPCEWASVAWGGTSSSLYHEAFRQNVAAIRPSAVIMQPISRNDGGTLASLQMLLARAVAYATEIDARLGFYGMFPMTTTADGSTTNQATFTGFRTLLNSFGQTCQPGTGGQTCPRIPVLDPAPVVSRAVLGGNSWDYLGMDAVASGAAAAGATTISITTQSGAPCYAGDTIADTTRAGVMAANATVSSSTTNSITVPGSAIIGGGIQSGDTLVCQMPGWTGGALTHDNTHPWYPAQALLQPAGTAFTQQLLGLQ